MRYINRLFTYLLTFTNSANNHIWNLWKLMNNNYGTAKQVMLNLKCKKDVRVTEALTLCRCSSCKPSQTVVESSADNLKYEIPSNFFSVRSFPE